MGRNVAAGMTGGLAYILDEDNTLIPKVCARDLFHYPFSIFHYKWMHAWTIEILFSDFVDLDFLTF